MEELSKLKFVGCQMTVSGDKWANHRMAEEIVRQAKQEQGELVVLPECWNCPYSNASFPSFAEDLSCIESKC